MASTDTAAAINKLTEEIKKMADAEGAGIPTPALADAGKVLMVDAEGKWTLAKILPTVDKVTDAGKVLTVDSDGAWAAEAVPTELPAVETTDEGKVLTVSDAGEWVAADLPGGE